MVPHFVLMNEYSLKWCFLYLWKVIFFNFCVYFCVYFCWILSLVALSIAHVVMMDNLYSVILLYILYISTHVQSFHIGRVANDSIFKDMCIVFWILVFLALNYVERKLPLQTHHQPESESPLGWWNPADSRLDAGSTDPPSMTDV